MDNTLGAVDVPLQIFGGLDTELAPSDIPEGTSPDNANVVFLPGSVATRPGVSGLYSGLTLPPFYAEPYPKPDGNPLNIIASGNTLYAEDVNNAPNVLTSIGSLSTHAGSIGVNTCLGVGANAFGRQYIAFSNGLYGTEPPLQYDGKYLDRVSQDGPGAAPTAVDSGAAGSISAGVHQCVVMFQTRQGYVTAPSPPVSWTAAGSKKVTIGSIPIGPPNVVARILAFTGAGGNNFFYIPATVTLAGTTTTTTVISDNTTTSIDIDFNDNSLFAATAIDIPGNNLFALRTLTPALGVFYYASRLFWWGLWNNVQGFLNMGFDGGYVGVLHPLGWTTSGSVSLTTSSLSGWALTINQNGSISQPAYQTYLGTAILQPLTSYSFRFYCVVASLGVDVANMVVDLYSPSNGVISSVGFHAPATGNWYMGNFSTATPAMVPSDLVLRITVTGTAGSFVRLDECMVLYTDQPYINTEMAGSYVINPESYDGVTGFIGPSSDSTSIQTVFNQRNNMYIVTERGLHQTQDQLQTEPSGWTVNELNQATGGVSPRCSSGGEDWQLIATSSGLRIFEGSEPYKVSQEIQSLWDSLNSDNSQFIWIKNVPAERRCYVSGQSGTTTNNKILVLDYRELDTAGQIAGSAPIRVSFSGRMLTAELGRKWTQWYPFYTSCGSVIARPNGETAFAIGTAVNGSSNLYVLDPTLKSDSGNVQIQSYYTTYFFVNHDAEQALGVGTHRKLYQYLTAFLSGTGNVQFQTLADSLTNIFETTPAYEIGTSPTFDYEWGIDTTGERVAVKLLPTPITDQSSIHYTNGTDCYFNLNKLIMTMKQDPWMPVRGVV